MTKKDKKKLLTISSRPTQKKYKKFWQPAAVLQHFTVHKQPSTNLSITWGIFDDGAVFLIINTGTFGPGYPSIHQVSVQAPLSRYPLSDFGLFIAYRP